MSILFSGKYDVYGKNKNQVDYAHELERQGVASHNPFGLFCANLAINSSSFIANGGLENLKGSFSKVGSIFKTVFNSDDSDTGGGSYEGLDGVYTPEDNPMDVASETQTLAKFNALYKDWKAAGGANRSVFAGMLKGFYQNYVTNGGDLNGEISRAYRLIESELNGDLTNLKTNWRDLNLFGV